MKMNLRTTYKSVYVIYFLFFILSISGCGKAYFPDTRLLSGEVRTINGNYPITKAQYWGKFKSSFNAGKMTMIPFSHPNDRGSIGKLELWIHGDKKHGEIKPVSAFYQINNNAKVITQLSCNTHKPNSIGYAKVTCKYTLPKILSYPRTYHSKEGLRSYAKSKLIASIKDTYRFNFNFNYSDASNPIIIDLKFKLKIKSNLYTGVPGM